MTIKTEKSSKILIFNDITELQHCCSLKNRANLHESSQEIYILYIYIYITHPILYIDTMQLSGPLPVCI